MITQVVKIKKNEIEQRIWQENRLVVGIDEVGRGCLAGPVVVAAAILPLGKTSPLLKDSKILNEVERQTAFRWITRHCAYQAAIIHPRLIDKHNIYQATLLGMKKALVNLLAQGPVDIGAIVVDAMPLSITDTGVGPIPVFHFYKGETKSSSIAAASIVAKVTRDELMKKYSQLFPGYQLEQHKGYATAAHQAALAAHKHSIAHRISFLNSFLPTDQIHATQQALF